MVVEIFSRSHYTVCEYKILLMALTSLTVLVESLIESLAFK